MMQLKPFFVRIRKPWFEVRIFISLSIVAVVSLLSFLAFKNTPSILETAGKLAGLTSEQALFWGYFFVAFLILLASLLRMWAGSILTSKTVMTFKVQKSKFLISGPYRLIRHPIYFADLVAFAGFSLCLTPIGLLMPLLIRLHYSQLMNYEEGMLITEFGESYKEYANAVPAIWPRMRQITHFFNTPLNFKINYDGFRHNAQYLLFIPGLIVSAFTGKFIHAVLIGLPAVIDWAIIHTIIGVSGAPAGKPEEKIKRKRLSNSKVFKDILYAQCWEDPQMDRKAFQIKPGDHLLSITSSGCNALTFLLDNPERVTCLDMNRYQNYLLNLKIHTFKALTHHEILEFFGITTSSRRWELYDRIKPLLPQEQQLYWENKTGDINKGILHIGRYEKYMQLLKQIFRILIGRKIIGELFNTVTVEGRIELYQKKWDNLRWRIFCRIFLSRTFASLFFDKAFYRYLEPSFSFRTYYKSAVKRAITELPVVQNYFLAYILLGNYFKENFPPYLREENYETIRKRVDRIEMVTSGCMEYFRSVPSDTITQFNFTNIFEWMSPQEFEQLLIEAIRIGKDGAILTYRNHLVTRNRPESLDTQLIPKLKLSEELHNKDLSFIYKAYVIEQVKKL